MKRFAVLALVAMLAFSGTVVAQDTAGMNAALSINGTDPSTQAGNAVSVPTASGLNCGISSGANMAAGIIFIVDATSGAVTNGANPTPWGGSIDLGAPALLADGIGLSTNPFIDGFFRTNTASSFNFFSTLNSNVSGTAIAAQCILEDPTFPPFLLDNTQPALISFSNATVTCLTLPDDGFGTVNLNVPVTFYGAVQNTLFVGSNGQVTFNTGTADFTETEAEFFNGFGAGPPNPGVGVFYSDLNRGAAASGALYCVTEDPNTNTVKVDFQNQNHWSSQEPAGSFSCTFDNSAASVTLDYSGFIPATINTDDGIIGVSNGDQLVGTDTSFSNGLGTGTTLMQNVYVSAGLTDSICETIPANTAIGSPIYTYIDIVGTGQWLIL